MFDRNHDPAAHRKWMSGTTLGAMVLGAALLGFLDPAQAATPQPMFGQPQFTGQIEIPAATLQAPTGVTVSIGAMYNGTGDINRGDSPTISIIGTGDSYAKARGDHPQFGLTGTTGDMRTLKVDLIALGGTFEPNYKGDMTGIGDHPATFVQLGIGDIGRGDTPAIGKLGDIRAILATAGDVTGDHPAITGGTQPVLFATVGDITGTGDAPITGRPGDQRTFDLSAWTVPAAQLTYAT